MRPLEATGYASPVSDALVNAEPGRRGAGRRTWLTRRQFRDIFTVLDAVIVLVSSVLAKHLYTAYWDAPIASDYILVGSIAALIHYVMIRAERDAAAQFRPDPPHSVLRRLAVTFAVVIVVGYGLKQAEAYSRIWLFMSLAIAFAGIVVKNRLALALIQRGRQSEYLVERIALYGDMAIAEPLKRALELEFDQLARITIYDAEISETAIKPAGSPVLTQLIADGLNNSYNRIVLCVPPAKLDHLAGLAAAIDFLPVQIQACPVPRELLGRQPGLAFSPVQFLLNLNERPHDDWGVVVKRGIDLVLGTAFLLAAAPLMLIAAIAIKLDSKGPVLFRQRRHGLNHAVISVLKLRSMTVAEDGDTVTQAVRGDARVTRVGRFLRRTSLDELPQLINVLRGDMSLVGPRPHALAHNLYYTDLIASYSTRHKVKPGITGWAQVKGLRGNSEDIARMAARADADIWYIRNWSCLLDLKIIFMTPFVFLFQKDAC